MRGEVPKKYQDGHLEEGSRAEGMFCRFKGVAGSGEVGELVRGFQLPD
jgi:hypothetical protein